MKKIFTLLAILALFLSSTAFTFADTWVNGYYKKNGTYVQGHYRSDRNGNKYDNWSTKGNYNPYTGKYGTHNVYGYSNYNYYTPSYNSYTPTYNSYYSTPSYNYDSSIFNKKTCSSTYGIMSIENLDGTCSCVSGYTFGKNNQCISKLDYCKENHGYGATYNYLNGQCECSTGYEVKNNQCVLKTFSQENSKYKKVDEILEELYNKNGEAIKALIPTLEKMLETESNIEKIDLINHMIEKINEY